MTKYYRDLQKQCKILKSTLLPAIYSPTGDYSKRTFTLTASFRLLAHSEIETYFENICKHIAYKAYMSWRSNRKVSAPLVSIVAYCSGKSFPLPDSLKDRNNTAKDIDYRISQAYTSYVKRIQSNNGIKETNLLNLTLPISLKISQLDQGFLNDLNSYGQKRGEIAHNSISVMNPPDPQTEEAMVRNLLSEIEILDGALNTINCHI